MADVNASIGVNIDASNALAQIKSLQRQIASFHASIAKSSSGAAQAQQDLQRNFINSINSISGFSAELRTVKTTAENFTSSLEKNKFSMREYFRYAGASTKTFGRLFRSEFDTINKVAVENVKRLQTQYIKMGRDASGAMRAIAIMPTELDMTNLTTKTQLAAQKQALFNQLVKQGSTNLLNFGKNTQWAGRQLMVGFTLPLITFGATATKAFMDMEAQALKFKKVYGDLFTTGPERQKALDEITALGQAFTKYGIAVSSTVGLAADAAAAGFQGIDLQRQTTEATRLQVLGQIDAQKALETTISLQNAFQMQSADLADSINFLNAVENQTVVSLDDITTAIPKAAPVVRQLGGDVKDLAFFMAAMKEGGINASEGANALKSGLASLINPTGKAKEMMSSFGIDIDRIVNKNAGNVKQTVIEFATALDGLSDLNRQRAIEQLFGKFQLARLSTLFENVTKSGNQASRVLDLATASTGDLAAMAEKELGMTADSAMNKFRKSVEDLKFALVPVGEVFLSVITPFIEKIGGLIEKFNGLSDTTKKVITFITVGIGAIAPVVLMTIGLIANFVANGIKGLMILRNGYLRLTGQSQILGEQTQYLTVEQQNALAAAHSLDQSHANLIQTFTVEAGTLNALKAAYERVIVAQNKFASRNPGMMVPGAVTPTKRAKGKPVVVGGTGNKDTELALLTPGETVIPTKMSKKYAGLINGMIADNIPGYKTGRGNLGAGDAEFAQSIGSIAPQRSQSAVTAFIEKELKAVPETLVAEFKSLVTTISQEVQLSKTELKAQLKEFRARYNANIYQQEELQFAHLDTGRRVQSGALLESGAVTDPKTLARLRTFVDAAGQEALVDLKTGFGVELTGFLNNAMQDAGASLEDVINDFQVDGVEKWRKSVEMGGGNVENLGDELIAFDTRFKQNLQDAYSRGARIVVDSQAQIEQMRQEALAKGETFDDTVYVAMDTIAEQTRQNVLQLGQGLDAVFEEAKNRITEIRYQGLTPQQQAALPEGFGRGTKGGRVTPGSTSYGRGSTVVGSFTNAPLAQQSVANVDGALAATAQAAGTASPSKKTIPIGEDIARGLQVGMANQQDDVARSGENLGTAAVAGTQSGAKRARRVATSPQGAPRPLPPPGATMLPIVSAPLVTEGEKLKKSFAITDSKLSSVNKNLNGLALGLTTAAGAGTMFGGKIGELSTQIFKYSGLLFGLMQITQLLTQVGFARLIAERAATAGILTKTATDAAGGAIFTRNTGLFAGGMKQLIPNLWKLGKQIIGMLGPWGKLAAITITVGSALWGLKNRADAQKEKIDALGNAARIAGDKLKSVGDYFGFVPKQTALDAAIAAGGTAASVPGQVAASISEYIKSDEFSKFKKDVEALKTATDSQARVLLEAMSLKLIASGASKGHVAILVEALKQQAGKTSIEINFKNIDLSTTEGLENLSKNISLIFDDLSKSIASGVKDNIGRSTNLVAQYSLSMFETLQLQLQEGVISLEQYGKSTGEILTKLNAIKDLSVKNNVMNTIFSSIGGVAQETANGITNVADKMLYLQAAMLGIVTLSDKIKTALSGGVVIPFKDAASSYAAAIAELKRLINIGAASQPELKKLFDSLTGEGGNTGGTVGNGLSSLSKKVIEGLNKEIKVLERKKKALQDVNNEIDRQQEFQIKQQQLDADMVQAKISGNYIQAALLGQQKLYNKSQYDRETAELDLERQIQALQDRVDAIEGGAKVTALDRKIAKVESNLKITGNTKKDSTKKPDAAKDPVNVVTYMPGTSTMQDVGQMAKKAKALKSNPFTHGMSMYFGFKANGQEYAAADSMANWYYKVINSGGEKIPVGKGIKFAKGGLISGPGTGMSDSIKATFGYAGGGSIRVSNGEYIMRAKAVKDYGISTMDSINNGNASFAQNSGTVYNIDMTINGANANANDIANQVISKLKVISNKNNKSNMVVR